MSHSVTITRTVTSSNTTSTLILNTGYLKTLPGLLKFSQLIVGAVCVGIIAYHYNRNYHTYGLPDLFFLLMATTFLIGTFCLLVSCLFSLSTGGIISKTIYELIYHTVAAILLLIASVYFLVKLQDYKNYNFYNAYTAAGALGILNTLLYIWGAVIARKTYRGI
ncbi:uncharacterized protein LOC129568454 isoform X2 [Sitodiplosis mosellana]|uniref:uncharacterized protein LOC129568454 isoform X2 n=1 Tax=Sitodiplosis mosellana TaxID=263140 RepID=UPI00244508D0|nr:uncharacterized protein LOC129568454 isoform X2 [Sitodiplosis mosellana]